MSGKGSNRRPQKVSREVYAENWERCFGNPFAKLERWRDEQEQSMTGLKRLMFGVPPEKEKP